MNKKKGCFKILLMLVLGGIAIILLWLVINVRPTVRDGHPLVRIAPETTVLDGPLDSNGDVDYLEALNLELSDGITPENNSMVKFMEGLGPIVEGSWLEPEFFERLGIIQPPLNREYFIDFFKWLDEQGIGGNKVGTSYDPYSTKYDFAMTAPWKTTDFPVLEQWYQRNLVPMESIREGTKRSRYYHPLIVPEDEDSRVISARLSVVQTQRELARFFMISAMRHLERNEVDESLDDVLAIYRLGYLTQQGATLVEDLIGIAITGIADAGVTTVCVSGKANSQQLKDFIRKLDEIPRPDGVAASLESAERYMCLDVILAIGRGDSSIAEMLSIAPGQPRSRSPLTDVALNTVDWAECMMVVNYWYERLIKAAKIEDRVQRGQALAEFEAELMAMQANTKSISNVALTLVGGRRAKGQAMGEVLIGLLTPAVRQVAEAETRCESYFERAKTLLAIAAFKSDHGKFPAKLDQLVPEYLDGLPLDPYSKSPMRYAVEQNEDGNEFVRLYAVGENGVDDNGQNELMSGSSGDDWAIEWHIPTWEVFEADAQKGSLNSWFDESEDISDGADGEREVESDAPPTPAPFQK